MPCRFAEQKSCVILSYSPSLYLFEQLSRFALERRHIEEKFLAVLFITELMHPKIRNCWLIAPMHSMIVQKISIPRQMSFEPENAQPDLAGQLLAVPEISHPAV